MLPDRVSNPGPLTYESVALPIALRGPAVPFAKTTESCKVSIVTINQQTSYASGMVHQD